jgi:hypothetical protein
MRVVSVLACAAAVCLAAAGQGGDKIPKQGIELEIRGAVATGLAAIGGETTGVVLRTSQGFGCELAGVRDEKWDKKTALVKGSYAVKAGVEIRQRAILTVSSIMEPKEKEEDYVKAKIVGIVKTGVAALGGGTTGVTITASGATWELDLGKDRERSAAAEKLNGKVAVVSGSVTVQKAKAAPPRPRTIVTVTEIKAAE